MDRDDHGRSVGGREGTKTVYLSTPVETIKAPKFQLTVVKGPDKGLELSWDSLILRGGSASDNDLELSDDTVSRHHFRIELDRKGYRLKDLESKNGVTIDSVAVVDGYLPPSCKITVGDTVLKYKQAREVVDVEVAVGVADRSVVAVAVGVCVTVEVAVAVEVAVPVEIVTAPGYRLAPTGKPI